MQMRRRVYIRKTHEEYVADLADKNPNVKVIGKYINTKTKITHYCLIHDIYWDTTPGCVLQGCGCKQCQRDKHKQATSKTHEEYLVEVNKVNPNIKVIEKYQGANIKILHKCLNEECEYEWLAKPHNVLNGTGCPKCVGNMKMTHSQYVDRLSKINSDIIVIDTYINSQTPILHKCLIDNHEWKVVPNSILNGKTGCPKCAIKKQSKQRRRTNIEYIQELFIKNPKIEPLEDYIDCYTPILHRCKECNNIWENAPNNILQGNNCPECNKVKMRKRFAKTQEQFTSEVNKNNPNIQVLGKYVNSYTPILCKCLLDGYQWSPKAYDIAFITGCPQCNQSHGEKKIALWLDNHNIEYIYQNKFDDCKDIRILPFDFYLPNYNTCIEYDGQQHFEPIEYFGGKEKFELTSKHDNIKNEYCKNNGISLLRIPYNKNIEEELNNFLLI